MYTLLPVPFLGSNSLFIQNACQRLLLVLLVQAQRERVVAADAKRQHLTVSASDAANWQVCIQSAVLAPSCLARHTMHASALLCGALGTAVVFKFSERWLTNLRNECCGAEAEQVAAG